ncbi:hypothetical protein Dimus_012605 [Dionaea muscipula]
MAKNRNKKKRTGEAPMEITEPSTVVDLPQAMDTSESAAPRQVSGSLDRKIKKGAQMKRSKNVRKMKGIAKAILINEKLSEKASKHESKKIRVKSAKSLYD